MMLWSEHKEPDEYCRYDHITADTPLGELRIEWKSWKQFDLPGVYLNEDYISSASTVDDAKYIALIHLRKIASDLNEFLKGQDDE